MLYADACTGGQCLSISNRQCYMPAAKEQPETNIRTDRPAKEMLGRSQECLRLRSTLEFGMSV